MKIIAEITIIPIGVGVSLSKYVAKTHQILQDTGLDIELHSNGTNIQGDYDTVMQAIKECHEVLHNDMKVPRISTLIKIGSRTDKEKIMTDKIESVKKYLK
jgi:uncharacterized protein (TIGR00106 family)